MPAAPPPQRTVTKVAEPKTGATVIVEDGTIVPNANCYIAVAYADEFHKGSLYSDLWEAATPDTKASAVISATRAIDANVAFNGYLVDPSQPLKWPRIYCPNDQVYSGYGAYNPLAGGVPGYAFYPPDQIPKELKDATALEALELMRVDRLADNPALGIKSMTVDVISLTYKDGSGSDAGGSFLPLSNQVAAMLAHLGTVTSGNSFAIIPVARVM